MDELNKVLADTRVAAADALQTGETGASSWLSEPVPRWWLGVAVVAGLVAGWLL